MEFHTITPSSPHTTPLKVQQRTTSPNRTGSSKNEGQRGSSSIKSGTTRRLPAVHRIPGTKEGWRSETSHKPEILKLFVVSPHFKMEGIQTFKSLVKRGDWMVKVYLKDTYFSVPINEDHRKYLCFSLGE